MVRECMGEVCVGSMVGGKRGIWGGGKVKGERTRARASKPQRQSASFVFFRNQPFFSSSPPQGSTMPISFLYLWYHFWKPPLSIFTSGLLGSLVSVGVGGWVGG